MDTANGAGMTALMYAAMRGHTDVVRVLLRAGAIKETKSCCGTAAQLAEAWGHAAITALLVDTSQLEKKQQALTITPSSGGMRCCYCGKARILKMFDCGLHGECTVCPLLTKRQSGCPFCSANSSPANSPTSTTTSTTTSPKWDRMKRPQHPCLDDDQNFPKHLKPFFMKVYTISQHFKPLCRSFHLAVKTEDRVSAKEFLDGLLNEGAQAWLELYQVLTSKALKDKGRNAFRSHVEVRFVDLSYNYFKSAWRVIHKFENNRRATIRMLSREKDESKWDHPDKWYSEPSTAEILPLALGHTPSIQEPSAKVNCFPPSHEYQCDLKDHLSFDRDKFPFADFPADHTAMRTVERWLTFFTLLDTSSFSDAKSCSLYAMYHIHATYGKYWYDWSVYVNSLGKGNVATASGVPVHDDDDGCVVC